MYEILNSWQFGVWLIGVIVFGAVMTLLLGLCRSDFRRKSSEKNAKDFRLAWRLWTLVPIWPLGLLWLAFRWIPTFLRNTKKDLDRAKELSS